MNPRQQMIQRCTVWRYVLGTADPYGHQEETPAEHLTNVPCRLWNAISAATGEVISGDRNYVLHEYRMIVPTDIDVTEADYVEGISDRRGNTINGNHMDIKAVIPRPGYMMLLLQEVT